MLLNKSSKIRKKSFIEELKTFPMRKNFVTFFSGRGRANIYNIHVNFDENFLARYTHFFEGSVTEK